ncbi:MAG: hypothetical protein BM557_11270 [Flavobacterium sp. MedPE-SWcel]|uniref:hypothetical protein n=1 Tax=uncultured Flavobacterium sp. TaxID=165435 RepID=UPI00091F7C93|nr:hypothetical protein [uncultured Flavobacterium sp.]OIQ15417.1 MAG: hypothetical protein BM557_11270 [Flavobacterium sp. MedPE-SWcel]
MNINRLKYQLESLDFPVQQEGEKYFPSFVDSLLEEYYNQYVNDISPSIDADIAERIRIKIERFRSSISEILKLYYSGNILEATQEFNQYIQEAVSKKIPSSIQSIPCKNIFYRARICDYKQLAREDNFHVKFENRHFVSTNRYSVPGFPALYLADSAYVCWEEFDRSDIKKMWFSKYENIQELNVIKIERPKDFIKSLNGLNETDQLDLINNYLVIYPLALICSIKVKNRNANFKSEYIVPQLLLQYVANNSDVHGIKFPSTKVDYSKISNLSAYNYVFPVKNIKEAGFCSSLTDAFYLTEPTNLDVEELIDVSRNTGAKHGYPVGYEDSRGIRLVNDVRSVYSVTAFGKIESILKKRLCESVYCVPSLYFDAESSSFSPEIYK